MELIASFQGFKKGVCFMFKVSGATLQDIVNFGRENPNTSFYCETEEKDGKEILSCAFFSEGENISGDWELEKA